MLPNENLYDEYFKKYGAANGIDWLLLKAQVKQESQFDPKAENKKSHAKGLSQFMDKTWLEWEDNSPGIQDMKRDYDPFNPEDSIRVQAAYFKWLKNYIGKLLKTETNIVEWTLAAYNWGIGYIQKKIMNESGNYFVVEKTLPMETQMYVIKIKKYYAAYIATLEK
jgi:soluble lytic murein transglycosylase-like protein